VFGGLARPDPLGELTTLPRPPSWILRVEAGKGGEGRAGGEGRQEGKGGGEERDGWKGMEEGKGEGRK